MDKVIASSLLESFVDSLRGRKYSDLCKLIGEANCQEIAGPDRKTYQLEFEAFWDDPRKAGGNLRIITSIDDGTFWASFRPITKSFIMAPDGSFVGDSHPQG